MKLFLFSLCLLTFLNKFIVQAADSQVQIDSNQFNSQVDNIAYCGSNRVVNEEDETIVLEGVESRISNIMFMTTTNGEVFLTLNHGQKWSNMTYQIQQQFYTTLNEGQLKISTIQTSPADSKTVFLLGNNGQSFIAEDCGKTLKMFSHEKKLENFKFNRQDKNLILAHLPVKCENKFDDECEEGENKLYVTQNMGQKWDKVLDNVFESNWDKLVHYSLVPDQRIIAHQRIYYQGKGNDHKLLTYSDDFYKTKKQIDTDVLHFYQSNHYLFLLTSNDEMPDSYTLKTAPAFAQDYKPQEIDLPVKRNKDHSFTVLDSIQGQMYIGINHEGHNSKLTNIYSSDFNGKKFSLNLMNAVRNEDGNVDFEKIQSNEGTFIANVYDSQELERINSKSEKPNNKKKLSAGITSLSQIKKTMISFNRGNTWHSLKAPVKTFSGEDINCSGECSLHLKGRTDNKGNPLYTSEAAPGLIIGTGNVGIYLEEKEENLNTYLSNDGGHTWLEIKRKPHLYEISDRGGIIVIARSDAETQHIHYSWDHGVTWTQLKISDEPLDIVNIVTETSNMSSRMLVFAKKKNSKQGTVIALNFSKLHQRVCSGQWDPKDPDSDFEFFTPINYNMEKCQFGSRIRYVRRKSDVPCFNPVEFDKIIDIQACECTEEDFTCTFGFYRDTENDGQCVPMSQRFGKEKKDLEKSPPNPCKGFYTVPTGYEKIHGTFCQGGIDLGPIRKECPPPVEEVDPKLYIPLEEEKNVVDLDALYQGRDVIKQMNQDQRQNNNNSEGGVGLFSWIIIIICIVGGFLLKEQIIEFIVQVISLIQNLFVRDGKSSSSSQNNYSSGGGRLGADYENLGLVNGGSSRGVEMDDEDEEQLQI